MVVWEEKMISREPLHGLLLNLADNERGANAADAYRHAAELVKNAPPAPIVSPMRYAQVLRERDMAMAQLEDIGAGYAEKMDDFVRVVRCKDCVWSGSNRVGNLCNCAINMHLVELDDYCSQGKRRADNG